MKQRKKLFWLYVILKEHSDMSPQTSKVIYQTVDIYNIYYLSSIGLNQRVQRDKSLSNAFLIKEKWR